VAEAVVGQIVAMGGGGFSMEPENPLLDDFVLSLARRRPARVCFLPTAGGDSPAYVARFYRALSARCVASDLTLVDSALPRRPALSRDIAEFIGQQDIFKLCRCVFSERRRECWPTRCTSARRYS
jgi:dipeptidase E